MRQVDKQYRLALILVLLFAVITGGYFAYEKYAPKDKDTVDKEANDKSEKISINTVKKEDVNEVEIKSSNADIILIKNNGKFEVKDNPKIDLDPQVVNSLLDNISSLNATKVIGENVTNMPEYGLAVPKTKLSYKVSGVPGKTIEVGDKLLERGYYIKFAGENKVYMVATETGENMRLDMKALRSKQVVTFNKDDINYVSLIKKNDTAFEAVADNANGGKWTVKKPYEIKADDVKVDEMVSEGTGLKVKEFIEVGNKSLDSYGLGNPSSIVKIGGKGGQTVKILVGFEKEEQGRYIMKEGSNEILLVESPKETFTSLTFKDVVDKSISGISSSDVTGIEAALGTDKIVIGIDQGKEPADTDDVVTVNNVKLTDKKSYTDFISSYTAIVASDIKPQDEVSKQPDLVISATSKKGNVKTAFIKKSDQEYYVKKNDRYYGHIITKSDYDKIVQALQQVKTAK